MSKINMIENPEVPGFEVSLPPMPPPPPPPIISRKHPNDLIKQTTLAVPSLPIAPGITLVDSQPILPNEQVGFDNILEPQSQVTPWWIPEENEEINNYQWLDNNQVNNVLNNINNDIKTNQKNVKRKIENVDAAEDAQLVACAQKELAALMEPLKCNLCNAIMNSTPQAKLHYDGKPHQKKVSMYLNQSVKKIKTDDVQVNSTSATKDNDSYCQTCKAWFTSQIDAAQHYAGKKHAKAIAAASKQEYTTTYGGALRCELCGISTNRLDQLETHRRGTKHIKMVKQKGLLNNNVEENQIKTPAVNYAINRTPSGSYYCATCNKSFNCENSFIQHVDSKKHKNQLAIKSFTNQSTQAVVKNKNIKPK
ncbi:hypothetical protein HCN44_006744 [Aphidius gifuensis]|uniref:C2H2-type domain-containing protein n=1 Tax=Aphidius gifuensis TaxID=684658 RepID=A0A834Y0R5_APHGI|nr:hypothetical protein HCN44_006744 [Aphidius gifuensis]